MLVGLLGKRTIGIYRTWLSVLCDMTLCTWQSFPTAGQAGFGGAEDEVRGSSRKA